MVGEGVLHQCLEHPSVEKVLVITRTASGYSHPKLTEIIHADLADISSLENRLAGYNSCYFCMGVTSMGKSEADYFRLTHTLTLNFAKTLAVHNPEMTFCYISGAGTDSSEKGCVMWARVKGKTENDLAKLPFRQVFNFRPAGILPFLPLKPTQTFYKTYRYLGWLFSLVKVVAPNYVVTLKDLAAAMINVSMTGYSSHNIEVKDIRLLAKKSV